MGVQVGIPGAGIAVGERCGDEPFGVDLSDTVGADTGEGGVVLQPLQHVGHRLVVSGLDLLGNLRRGDRPERRDRLHRRERQVIAGDRRGARPRGPRDEP
jgi:hypothetical protein